MAAMKAGKIILELSLLVATVLLIPRAGWAKDVHLYVTPTNTTGDRILDRGRTKMQGMLSSLTKASGDRFVAINVSTLDELTAEKVSALLEPGDQLKGLTIYGQTNSSRLQFGGQSTYTAGETATLVSRALEHLPSAKFLFVFFSGSNTAATSTEAPSNFQVSFLEAFRDLQGDRSRWDEVDVIAHRTNNRFFDGEQNLRRSYTDTVFLYKTSIPRRFFSFSISLDRALKRWPFGALVVHDNISTLSLAAGLLVEVAVSSSLNLDTKYASVAVAIPVALSKLVAWIQKTTNSQALSGRLSRDGKIDLVVSTLREALEKNMPKLQSRPICKEVW